MIELCRTVRFCINPTELAGTDASCDNTFAACPSMRGLGRYYELDVACLGEVDARSGYFVNIKHIDQAARRTAIPMIARACAESPAQDPGSLVASLRAAIEKDLFGVQRGMVRSVRWWLTPFYSVESRMSDPKNVLIRQQFEFAASHRLHCADLSDDENRRLFGKCNHASGHGHNYRVEPCVAVPAAASGTGAFGLAQLESLTSRIIVERFDHKHLNADCPEFRDLNPSVENIARVCFELLDPAVQSPAELRSVTVWETYKTSCTYPA